MSGSRLQRLAPYVIALAVVAAYANAFSTPFFFDDNDVIKANPSIRSFATALFPPAADGMTVSGRPLINLSIAINYAVSGLDVWSYHVFNVAIHIAAALALFSVIRRTMEGPAPAVAEPSAGKVSPTFTIAFSTALLWALHPLQTESVTYISQRAESIVSLFYLLTIYCFIRWSVLPSGRIPTRSIGERVGDNAFHLVWAGASVLACFLGMASKEVMVSAPLAVLAYDAIFVSGGLKGALRQRRVYYLFLFASWILLAILVSGSAGRGGTAGAGAGISVWHYVLTQCKAVVLYVRLAIWPHPLIFDYGVGAVRSAVEVVVPALVLAALVAGAVFALVRRPKVGFAAALFFAILAPSSSFVPVATQTIAEHRMYLALAPLLFLAVAGLWRIAGRRTLAICAIWAIGLGAATYVRNTAYASELSLWSDNVRKLPSNSRARANLGKAYLELGRESEALAELDASLQLGPPTAEAHFNRGLIAQRHGDIALAGGHFEAAAIIYPRYAEAHMNLGVMLDRSGRLPEGLKEVEEAVRLKPDLAEARINLGNMLARSGRLAEAMPHFETGVALSPNEPVAHMNYATALFQGGRLADAQEHLAKARDLDPNDAAIRQSLGFVLLQLNRPKEAAVELQRALEIDPNMTSARELLQRIPR